MRLEDYLDLVTSQHRKTHFLSATSTAVAPVTATGQFVTDDFARAFDLDTAVGVQLDKIGEWVGRSRRLRLPLTGVYFAWDNAGSGWAKGYWKGAYDPETGLIALPDNVYRRILRAKIALNSWDGTKHGAYVAWNAAFSNEDGQDMTMAIEDGQDMTMAIGVSGAKNDLVLHAMLREGWLCLKPEGVRVRYYATSSKGMPMFGWGIENKNIAGWSSGEWIEKISMEV